MYTRLLFYQKTEGLRERLAVLKPFVLIMDPYFAQYILPFLPLNIRSFYKNILVNDLMAPVHRSSIKRQKKG